MALPAARGREGGAGGGDGAEGQDDAAAEGDQEAAEDGESEAASQVDPAASKPIDILDRESLYELGCSEEAFAKKAHERLIKYGYDENDGSGNTTRQCPDTEMLAEDPEKFMEMKQKMKELYPDFSCDWVKFRMCCLYFPHVVPGRTNYTIGMIT